MKHLIELAKIQLTVEAKRKGVYKDFGQREVNKLLSNPKCDPSGTQEQKENHAKVIEFSNWIKELRTKKK